MAVGRRTAIVVGSLVLVLLGLLGFAPGATSAPELPAAAIEHRGGHGPDPAPAGVDMSRRPSTVELEELAETTGTSTTTSSAASVPCYGDGTTGKRVQAIYAVASDVADRYSDVVGLIRGYAAAVDKVVYDSAAVTGGVRHVRWVTDAACQLAVERVVVSRTGDDSFYNLVAELQQKGFKRTDRKYLIWADAAVNCGVADMYTDDQPGANNANNGGAMYARVDAPCWGQANSVEAHELMHTLGGVQFSAPNTTYGGHCTDENDRMCYVDSQGVTLRYVCPTATEKLFDCNNDDYFHTAPATGTYLSTHWNAANNLFLEQAEPGAPAPAPAPEPEPEPAPAPAPTEPSTTTTTLSGSISRKASTSSHTVEAGSGTLTADLTFGGKSTLTMTLKSSAGTTLTQASGKKAIRISTTVEAGSYVLEVSGAGSVTYTLTVTSTTP